MFRTPRPDRFGRGLRLFVFCGRADVFFENGFMAGFEFIAVADSPDSGERLKNQVVVLIFDDAREKIVRNTEFQCRSLYGEGGDLPEPLTVQMLVLLHQTIRGDRPDFRHAALLRIHNSNIPVFLL